MHVLIDGLVSYRCTGKASDTAILFAIFFSRAKSWIDMTVSSRSAAGAVGRIIEYVQSNCMYAPFFKHIKKQSQL